LDRVSDHTSETMFEGIFQIRPGCKFRWSSSRRLEIRRYWKYEPTGERQDISGVAEEFRKLFEDSIRLRLRSDVHVGCLVSGGLDSSSVFSVAKRQSQENGKNLYTFSTRVSPRTEENSLIDLLINSNKDFHFEDSPSKDEFEADVNELIFAQEEPFADGTMLAHFRLMRMAREADVKVLLSGQGGDEFVDGYPGSIFNFLASLLKQRRIRECARWMEGFHNRYKIRRSEMAIRILGHVAPRGFSDFYIERSFHRRAQWISPEYFKDCGRSRYSEEDHGTKDPYLRYLQNISTSFTLPGFLHYEDRNSMHFGVEVRHPFLDYRMVEFLGALGPEVKMQNCETKHLIRKSLRGIMPDEILDRHKKEPWPAPLQKWMRESDEIRDEVIDKSAGVPFARVSEVNALMDKYRKGHREVKVIDVWRMASAILWYHRFFV